MNKQENKELNINSENLTTAQDVNQTENYEYITNGKINQNVLPPFESDGTEKTEKKKICPWQIEDLSHIYNLERFPDRERREAKELRKYNLVANISIVTALLLCKDGYFNYKTDRGKVIKELTEHIDIPESTFETKLSQLYTIVYKTGKKKENAEKKIANGIPIAYRLYKDVECKDLLELFETHEIYGDILETAFINLREKSLSNSNIN